MSRDLLHSYDNQFNLLRSHDDQFQNSSSSMSVENEKISYITCSVRPFHSQLEIP